MVTTIQRLLNGKIRINPNVKLICKKKHKLCKKRLFRENKPIGNRKETMKRQEKHAKATTTDYTHRINVFTAKCQLFIYE